MISRRLLPPLLAVACLHLGTVVAAYAGAENPSPAPAVVPATAPAELPPAATPAGSVLPAAPAVSTEAAVTAVETSPPAHATVPAPDAPAPDPAIGAKAPATTTKPSGRTQSTGIGAQSPRHSPSVVEIESLLKLAPLLTDRGDYQAAEIAYYQVLNARTASANHIRSGLLGLARMHRKQGSLTKAVAIYERFLKDNPTDERTPDALLDLGRTLRALGLHKFAIGRFYAVLNSTLKVTGGNLDHYQLLAKTAQFEIAQTHFEAGEFAEAHKFFTRLRLLDLAATDRARAHFMSAYAQRLQGQREGAAANLRSFIEQSPDDDNVPEARYLLALTLRELNRPQEALTATLDLLRVEKARIAIDPKRWSYWQRRTGNQLANDFYEAGDVINAQTIYAGLVELAPEPAWRLPLTYQIALCSERLGMLDRARASYQAILDATGATPPAEFAELARMATWRLNHLGWQEGVARQITTFFSSTTGKTAATAPPPAAAAAKP